MATQGLVGRDIKVLYDGTTSVEVDIGGNYTFLTAQTVGTGSVTWQATIDRSTWVNVVMTKLADDSTESVSTAAGFYRVQCSGFRKFRVTSASGFSEVIAVITT